MESSLVVFLLFTWFLEGLLEYGHLREFLESAKVESTGCLLGGLWMRFWWLRTSGRGKTLMWVWDACIKLVWDSWTSLATFHIDEKFVVACAFSFLDPSGWCLRLLLRRIACLKGGLIAIIAVRFHVLFHYHLRIKFATKQSLIGNCYIAFICDFCL